MNNHTPKLPFFVPAEAIGLPTGGAVVERLRLIRSGETDLGYAAQMFGIAADTDYYSLEGRIRPVDPKAQDICFELGIPLNWNGKLIQAGGGGMDGFVIPSVFPMSGQDQERSALKQGYAVVGSDGGHQMDPQNPLDCTWILNRETFCNFASDQLKKTRDTACFLLGQLAGKTPERVYFYGGSNGGRECMKAIQNYPADYDGAICFYPVLYWISKILKDCSIADALEDGGTDGVIAKELQDKITAAALEVCDGLDGKQDGLICDLDKAREKSADVKKKLEGLLNPAQQQVLDAIGSDLKLSFPLGYGSVTLPGYQVYEGTPLEPHLTATPDKRETGPGLGADDFLKYAVVGDENYDVRHFDSEKWQDKLCENSRLLDAYDTNLDTFFSNGGKLLLVQGTADPLVCVYGTIRYYERLSSRYQSTPAIDSMRCYIIPGFGHGPGGSFLPAADFIGAMDDWVTKGAAPAEISAADRNPETAGRILTLKPYPEKACPV